VGEAVTVAVFSVQNPCRDLLPTFPIPLCAFNRYPVWGDSVGFYD
jgi:hypothetical protein